MYDRHILDDDDLLLDILTNIRSLTNLPYISAILQQSKIVLGVYFIGHIIPLSASMVRINETFIWRTAWILSYLRTQLPNWHEQP